MDHETKAAADEKVKAAAEKKAAAQEKTKAAADEKVINLCQASKAVCDKVSGLYPESTVEVVMVGKTQAGINIVGADGKKEFQKVSIV